MKLVKISIDELKPSPYNPRIDIGQNDKIYKDLKTSIERFGYVEPIIWNKRTGRVVGGHQRLKVLKDKGIKEIEVVEVDLDEEKEKELNLALNKIINEWDFLKLGSLIDELKNSPLTNLGFTEEEISLITQNYEEFLKVEANLKQDIKQVESNVDGEVEYKLGDFRGTIPRVVYNKLADTLVKKSFEQILLDGCEK